METILGGLDSEIVLARDDGGQQRIAAYFQLGELEIGLGLPVCLLSLFLSGIAGGLGLNDLLLGLGLIGLRLAEIVLLLSGVEFDDCVAGCD